MLFINLLQCYTKHMTMHSGKTYTQKLTVPVRMFKNTYIFMHIFPSI